MCTFKPANYCIKPFLFVADPQHWLSFQHTYVAIFLFNAFFARVMTVIMHTYDNTKPRIHPDCRAAVRENCHYMLPTGDTKWHLRYPLVSEGVGRKEGRGWCEKMWAAGQVALKAFGKSQMERVMSNMSTLKWAFYMQWSMQPVTQLHAKHCC